MKAVKWLDEHFEEVILIFFLIVISCVELLQVICRNVPIFPSLTWAEELCRFAWIATVFLSLPYTIRTETPLRVTALIDAFPWKLRNLMNIIVDVITVVLMAVLSYAAFVVLQRIIASGEVSPAMLWPMWTMYLIVLIGFVGAALRSVEMCIIHIKHFNEPPADTMEQQAQFELSAEMRNAAKEEEAAQVDEKGGAQCQQ